MQLPELHMVPMMGEHEEAAHRTYKAAVITARKLALAISTIEMDRIDTQIPPRMAVWSPTDPGVFDEPKDKD